MCLVGCGFTFPSTSRRSQCKNEHRLLTGGSQNSNIAFGAFVPYVAVLSLLAPAFLSFSSIFPFSSPGLLLLFPVPPSVFILLKLTCSSLHFSLSPTVFCVSLHGSLLSSPSLCLSLPDSVSAHSSLPGSPALQIYSANPSSPLQ